MPKSHHKKTPPTKPLIKSTDNSWRPDYIRQHGPSAVCTHCKRTDLTDHMFMLGDKIYCDDCTGGLTEATVPS